MGNQYRTRRAGAGELFVTAVTAAASGGPPQISNYGITNISALTTAAEYVLDAPVEGVRKTLIQTSSVPNSIVVRMSSSTTVKVGNQLATQITFMATTDICVNLIGLNSTRWVLDSCQPPIAANSTGVVIATS